MQIPETEIIVTKDGAEILRKTVRPGEYVIGREPECEVPVENELVSRRHAQLTVNFDHVLIEDLGSIHGTFVNGKPVKESTRLWPNQKIQIGAATVELRRIKTVPAPDVSLAPSTATVKRLLPEEFLHEKRYDIGGVVAQGGMGAILDARETATERTVAMKVMLDGSNPEELARFVAEAKVTAQLEHPNIVPVHELGVDENDQVYYTMKFVQGITLKKVIEQLTEGDAAAMQKYPLPVLLTIFQKVCDAIAFAHSKGVIHRDLKPENIMLGDFGEALVMDWGLAKRMKDEGGAEALRDVRGAMGTTMKLDGPSAGENEPFNARSAQESSSFICPHGTAGVSQELGSHPSSFAAATLAGSIMGTPQYMAPEQAEGRIEDMDARSDIFSLGGVLYSILTLRPPVEGKTLEEVLQKVISGSITAPSALGATTSQGKETARGEGGKAQKSTPTPMEGETFDEASPTLVAGSIAAPPSPAAAAGQAAPAAKSGVLEARKIKPLPHVPGGRVPAALSAVAMKALSLKTEDRYQTVVELSADLAAYQNGFATRAEHASFMKQILLLIRRNKGIFVTGFAAWLVITALVVWFIINLRAGERETRRQAEIAQQNEQRAEASAAEAKAETSRATKAEATAVQEKEAARQALAKSALALAEAARREGNGPEMQAALGDVPEDLRDSTWHYLLEQSDSSIARVSVSKYGLSGVAAHPRRPGVFAIADETSNKIILLDVRTGKHLLEFAPGFTTNTGGASPKLAFSPDGERIAVGRNGAGGIVIHSAQDGKKLLAWEAPNTLQLEFSPDGKLLLQVEKDQKLVTVWDAATGGLHWKYEPEGGYALGTFTPDSQQVVTQGYKEHNRLVNALDGTVVRPISNDYLKTFAVSPDGKLLVTGGRNDGRVKGVQLQDGKVLFEFRATDRPISRVAFTPDGARFVSVSALADGRQAVQVWDAATGAPLQTLLGGTGSVLEAGVHPLSGELLVAGPSSRVWDLTGTPAKWTLRGGTARPNVAFWGSEDFAFASAPGSYPAALLKLQAGKPTLLWNPPSGGYSVTSVSADGRFAAIGFSGGTGPSDVVLLRTPGAQTEQIAVFKPTGTLTTLRLNATGDRLAAIQSFWGAATVYDPITGQQPIKLEHKDMKKFWDLGWVSGGQQLMGVVTAKADRGNPGSEEWIVLWDAATGKIVRTATNRTAMDVLAVAPDGTRFAEAGVDKLVRIRDATTLAVQQEFRAHDGPITALAWHPTKPIVATTSADLSVKLWNLETGRRLEELRGPLMPPEVLAFSPSGQRLGCAGKDGTRIWDPQSLNDQPTASQETDGWEDLLATFTPAAVMQAGNGWRLENGALFSPGRAFATLPLPGNLSGTSYQVRVKLRQLRASNCFQLEIPVADRMVGFGLDDLPKDGFYTGLSHVDGKLLKNGPGVVHGRQVKDSEQHDLEVTVHLDGANATITTTLDGQPLYQWTGPTATLSEYEKWVAPAGTLTLGTKAADWVVYEVKVKRLEK